MLGKLKAMKCHRLKRCARHTGTVARLGGDESGIIVPPVDLSVDIETMIQRIYSTISQPLHFEEQIYPLNGSIGASEYPADSTDINSLLDIADQRMYRVKQQHHIELESARLS